MKSLNFDQMQGIQGGALTNGEACLIGIGASIVFPTIWTFAIAMTFCLAGDK